MNRNSLIEKLDKATDRAVSVALVRSIPIPVNKKSTLIGNIVVEKNKKGLYNVTTLENKILFELKSTTTIDFHTKLTKQIGI